jgi:hypothetical protein
MQTEAQALKRIWWSLFCLLSRSGELVGFGSGDYKPNNGHSDNEINAKKTTLGKTRFPYQPVQGGKKANREMGTGGKN